MPPHPVQVAIMPWIRHVPNMNLLIPTTLLKSGFHYLPDNTLLRNSQNFCLVIVFDDCSLLALLPAIHHFARLVWGGSISHTECGAPGDHSTALLE